MKYSECKTEQAFKMEWIRRHRKDFTDIFCIETEETVKGFPDMLAVDELNGQQFPQFIEFKKARNGWIEFQPTQLPFYRQHNKLAITVLSLVELKGKFYAVGISSELALEKVNGNRKIDLKSYCTEETEIKE